VLQNFCVYGDNLFVKQIIAVIINLLHAELTV